jgi:dihydropteroate synthase
MRMETAPDHNKPGIHGRIRVMGILNVTPDSFSDGSRFNSDQAIQSQIEQMIEDGADIIDVGGESSRPFSQPVSLEEELSRVLPVIKAIRQQSSIPVSIDTTKAEVARQALDAGADIVNDISALRSDVSMVELLADQECPVIIMHMQGTPGDMQTDPTYDNVVEEISAFLQERIKWAVKHGIAKERLIVDPGIGFGKTIAHNLSILKHLDRFSELGCPVLLGHSRKAFIGKTLDLEVDERDTATAIISSLSAAKKIDIIRVHDVAKTVQAIKIAQAIEGAE